MVKKAIIVISLVDESKEKENEELEKEILEELNKWPVIIPWMKNIKEVSVTEDCTD